jgi:hypothetical protein
MNQATSGPLSILENDTTWIELRQSAYQVPGQSGRAQKETRAEACDVKAASSESDGRRLSCYGSAP